MMSLEKDERIEHLQRQVNLLGNILRVIDQDVANAAKKYLKSTGPHNYLRMAEFIDLLALEMKREARDLPWNVDRLEKMRKEILTNEINDRIEQKILGLMPVLRSKVSEYITIQILIRGKDESYGPLLRGQSPKVYRASPLRGSVRGGLGHTPEEAYTSLRESMIIDLSLANTREKVAQFLSVTHNDLKAAYSVATPYRTDEIEGFKVEVRIKA